MDDRLTIRNGTQILSFKADTIPLAARALTLALSGQVRMVPTVINHMRLVHFTGNGIDLYIHEKDWQRILEGMIETPIKPTTGIPWVADISALNYNFTRQFETIENALKLIFT